MVSKPLLFYDSGAGGLPYLQAARKRLPYEDYIYLADRKNFPLGEKTEKTVRRLVLQSITGAVRRFDPGLIVVACNTASAAALQALRKHFPLPFVGVVPALKPAALSTDEGKVAVLATRGTAVGPYLEGLIREFADDRDVVKVPVANLVEFAEYQYLSATVRQRLDVVREALQPLLKENVRTVVLGCTHFVLLEGEFRRILPDVVSVVDSREGVTNRIVSMLEHGRAGGGKGREHTDGPVGTAELYLHGGTGEEERYRSFARAFSVQFSGFLEEK
jgi:glutamate racemase